MPVTHFFVESVEPFSPKVYSISSPSGVAAVVFYCWLCLSKCDIRALARSREEINAALRGKGIHTSLNAKGMQLQGNLCQIREERVDVDETTPPSPCRDHQLCQVPGIWGIVSPSHPGRWKHSFGSSLASKYQLSLRQLEKGSSGRARSSAGLPCRVEGAAGSGNGVQLLQGFSWAAPWAKWELLCRT